MLEAVVGLPDTLRWTLEVTTMSNITFTESSYIRIVQQVSLCRGLNFYDLLKML